MKSSKIIIPIIIIAAVLLILFVLIAIIVIGLEVFFIARKNMNTNTTTTTTTTTINTTTTNPTTIVEVGDLTEFHYSPGYSDMDGASHSETLMKNDNGEWIIESWDQESWEDPMIVTVYSVSDEEFEIFEKFIKEQNICDLENRPDSDEFVTDYSSWGYGIEFDNTSIGGDKYERYNISEYKQYSDLDYEKLKALKSLFETIHGGIISQTEEED